MRHLAQFSDCAIAAPKGNKMNLHRKYIKPIGSALMTGSLLVMYGSELRHYHGVMAIMENFIATPSLMFLLVGMLLRRKAWSLRLA